MTRQGLQKLKEWRDLLQELCYDKEDRKWFVDFWVAKHDENGRLRSDAANCEQSTEEGK